MKKQNSIYTLLIALLCFVSSCDYLGVSDQLRMVCGDPDLWKFQSGDHFAGRYWNFSDISLPEIGRAHV